MGGGESFRTGRGGAGRKTEPYKRSGGFTTPWKAPGLSKRKKKKRLIKIGRKEPNILLPGLRARELGMIAVGRGPTSGKRRDFQNSILKGGTNVRTDAHC